MLGLDPITRKELVRFLIPTALGCFSYIAATAAARFISPIPRHIYIGRLVFLTLFFVLIWTFYLPSTAISWSGPRERYYALGGEARGMGTFYGIHTIWIWFVLALLKRPKSRGREKNLTK
jgi:hypothetical protein